MAWLARARSYSARTTGKGYRDIMNPTKAQICARIREFEQATKIELPDDEVKGVLCSVWSDKRIHAVEKWEAITVEFCVRALGERSTSPKPKDE